MLVLNQENVCFQAIATSLSNPNYILNSDLDFSYLLNKFKFMQNKYVMKCKPIFLIYYWLLKFLIC